MQDIEEKTLDNYEIVNRLYERTSRTISLVKSKSSGKNFILKQIISDTPPLEIKFHKTLSKASPSILKLESTWSIKPNYYMLIEYCECGDLYKYLEIKPNKPSPLKDVLSNCLEVSLDLKVLHDMNICHRDIKPHNIFITSSGKLKLGDFETCKEVDDKESYATHSIRGTKAYLSPGVRESLQKKLKNKENPYKRDIWSLGKTFFEIATATFYHEINTCNPEVIEKILSNDLKRINYPLKFSELLIKMMCSEELVDINQVILRLNEIKQSLPVFYSNSEENENNCVGSSARYPKCDSSKVKSAFDDLNLSKPNKHNFWYIEQKALVDSKISSGFLTFTNEKVFGSNHKGEEEQKAEEFHKNLEFQGEKDAGACSEPAEELKTNKESIISNISPQESSDRPLQRTTCAFCSEVIQEACESIIGCQHFYHPECLKNYYEPGLESLTSKSELFSCCLCQNKIEFEYFISVNFFSQEARFMAKKQNLARQKFICPNCLIETRKFTLNDDLKVQKVNCKVCRRDFCSFCSVKYKILHKVRCKRFKSLKNAETMGDLVNN